MTLPVEDLDSHFPYVLLLQSALGRCLWRDDVFDFLFLWLDRAPWRHKCARSMVEMKSYVTVSLRIINE